MVAKVTTVRNSIGSLEGGRFWWEHRLVAKVLQYGTSHSVRRVQSWYAGTLSHAVRSGLRGIDGDHHEKSYHCGMGARVRVSVCGVYMCVSVCVMMSVRVWLLDSTLKHDSPLCTIRQIKGDCESASLYPLARTIHAKLDVPWFLTGFGLGRRADILDPTAVKTGTPTTIGKAKFVVYTRKTVLVAAQLAWNSYEQSLLIAA